MATTAANLQSPSLPSFSLSNRFHHVSAKRTKVSSLDREKSVLVYPIRHHGLSSIATKVSISMAALNGSDYSSRRSFVSHGKNPVDPTKKPGLVVRDLIAAKATEVVAPTSGSEGKASSESSSSKKGKDSKYPRKFLDLYQILQYPIITESAIKNIADENSLLFTVDVHADKKMIKDAVKSLFGVKVRKVNTSIRPDGTKKAFIMLSKENNASDVAKSIGIFPSSG